MRLDLVRPAQAGPDPDQAVGDAGRLGPPPGVGERAGGRADHQRERAAPGRDRDPAGARQAPRMQADRGDHRRRGEHVEGHAHRHVPARIADRQAELEGRLDRDVEQVAGLAQAPSRHRSGCAPRGWRAARPAPPCTRPRPKAASSQNETGRPIRPRGTGCTSTCSSLSKRSCHAGVGMKTWPSCSSSTSWRARSVSSITQRGERCSASASVSATAVSPPEMRWRVRPTCGASSGSWVPASSIRPRVSERQSASRWGRAVIARTSASTARQPSSANTASKRRRQPTQRAA